MADKPIPFAACGVLLAMASAAAAQPRAEFIELPANFRAKGISGDGRTVVGYQPGISPRAGYWTRERGLVWLPGEGQAEAVNHDGSVIVGIAAVVGGCRWVNGGPPEGLGALPGQPYSSAWAVSADGTVIVGTSGPRLPFRWTPQRGIEMLTPGTGWDDWEPADVSADGQTVVGVGYNTLGQENGAIQWPRTGGMRTLHGLAPSAIQEYARAVSGDGAMTVGTAEKPDGRFRTVHFAAVWPEDGGPPRDLGMGNPAIHVSTCLDVTDSGDVIVGTARTRDRELIGTAYTAQTGFVMLQERLETDFGLGQGVLDGWGILKISGNSEALLLQRGTSNAYAVVYWPGYCVADCELDGALDVFDYLCFLNKWTENDPYACDFDATTGPGICDTFDFVEFGTLFARGFCR